MKDDLHRRAGEIFLDICDLDEEGRRRRLEETCAGQPALRERVEALLAGDASPRTELDAPALEHWSMWLAGTSPDALPEKIADFRILSILGEGGMGLVFEARQERPSRRVALKVLGAGLATPRMVARLEHEAEVLAVLEHPGIARVYGAGSEEGAFGPCPWISMELIEGQSLLAWSESSELDTRGRLELIARVCDAVQYAHRRGVIHRDLKPSNILVRGDGKPVVLDFGVARVFSSDRPGDGPATEQGQWLGTLPYMSPEQVRAEPGEIDVRSDVYALGVLLYQLLSGRLPNRTQGMPIHEAARAILEEDPPRLGDLDRALRGDVEAIVHRAIHKDVDQRYASAEELAQDLRAYLGHRPVSARRPSWGYLGARFARRHRTLVAGLLGIAATGLIGGLVSFRMYLRAEDKAEIARDEADTAKEAVEFLIGVFELSIPDAERGASITARDVLMEGAARLRHELSGRPKIRARLLEAVGRAQMHLGLFDEAVGLLDEALGTQRALLGEEHVDTLQSKLHRASLAARSGRYPRAEELFGEVIDVVRPKSGEEFRRLEALGERGLAQLSSYRGDLERAATHTARLIVLAPECGGDAPDLLAQGTRMEAFLALEARDFDRAEDLFRDALAQVRALYGEASNDVPRLLGDLGWLAMRRGEVRKARLAFEDALSRIHAVYPPQHPEVINSKFALGSAFHKEGRLDEAEVLYREALEGWRASGATDHAGVAAVLGALGALLQESERPAEAIEILGEALGIELAIGERNRSPVASILRDLAFAHADLGDLETGTVRLREAIEVAEAVGPRCHDLHVYGLSSLGDMCEVLGDPAGARRAFEDSLAVARSVGGPVPIEQLERLALHGLESGMGGDASAWPWTLELLGEGIDAIEGGIALEDDPDAELRLRGMLAEASLAGGEREVAEAQFLWLHREFEGRGSEAAEELAFVRGRLVELYDAWGRSEDAARWR